MAVSSLTAAAGVSSKFEMTTILKRPRTIIRVKTNRTLKKCLVAIYIRNYSRIKIKKLPAKTAGQEDNEKNDEEDEAGLHHIDFVIHSPPLEVHIELGDPFLEHKERHQDHKEENF